MDGNSVKQFKDAVDAVGIKTYAYVSMGPTVYYHNQENSICIEDFDHEMIYNFRGNDAFGSASYFENSKLLTFGCSFDQICEVRLGADYTTMLSFIDNLGLNITEDQKKLLLQIANRKRPLNPITGNYVFKELSEAEYEALNEDEKAAYKVALQEYTRKKNGMQSRQLVVE